MKRTVLLAGVIAMFFSASAACAEEVRVATGHTFIKRVFDPVRNAFREKTGTDIAIIFKDPVPALAELERGNADVAGASLTLENWLELCRKARVPVGDVTAYSSYVAAVEKSMVVVNAANKVQTLSKEQLKGIFTGRITNWKDVGGDEAPILVVWPSVSSGALIVFNTRIMDSEAVTKSVYDVESIGETAEAVAATPEAIGIVTGMKAEAGMKEVAPAIERPLTLVYKGKPAPPLQKLLDFLKVEGNRYIK